MLTLFCLPGGIAKHSSESSPACFPLGKGRRVGEPYFLKILIIRKDYEVPILSDFRVALQCACHKWRTRLTQPSSRSTCHIIILPEECQAKRNGSIPWTDSCNIHPYVIHTKPIHAQSEATSSRSSASWIYSH